jgi:hypothetical protein
MGKGGRRRTRRKNLNGVSVLLPLNALSLSRSLPPCLFARSIIHDLEHWLQTESTELVLWAWPGAPSRLQPPSTPTHPTHPTQRASLAVCLNVPSLRIFQR